MADLCDRAERRQRRELELSIAAARQTVAHLPGDALCRRCGELNDRAAEGYGVCASCVEEVRDGGG